MRGQMNQRITGKPSAKKTAQAGHLKAVGTLAPPKKAAGGSKTSLVRVAGKASGKTAKADQLFSYKSADDKNVLAIIEAVRSGISFQEFEKIVRYAPFTLSEWASYLQLSERTIQRNQKEKKAFQPIQSERIVELVMLYQYGVEVFGDKDNFNTWLNAKSIALGGRTPKELLDTKFGVDMIKDELGRIEHGILA